jgi:hypothetical protein
MNGSAFSLTLELLAGNADITAMLHTWIKLSELKGWPKNEEGWRRYLNRLNQEGNFPTTKPASDKVASKSEPVPDLFMEWWKTQFESQ